MGKVSKRGDVGRSQKGGTKVISRGRGESLTHWRPSVFRTRESTDRQTHVELAARLWLMQVLTLCQGKLCQERPGHG